MQPCNIMYDPRVVRGTTLTHTTAIGVSGTEETHPWFFQIKHIHVPLP